MRNAIFGLVVVLAGTVSFLVPGAHSSDSAEAALWQHRNLGKAFYENPTTQLQAVDEFKKALDLAPDSARERVNYGLALLRAGKTAEGIAELEKAQKQDPKIPHTWFNLGIVFKRDSQYDRAAQQLEQMAKLVPDEPITHYNLGVLYKLLGKQNEALRKFEIAAKLNPNLAGPHFQLYNTYRQVGRNEDSNRELAIFQEIKKRQAGAAIPEDLEWSFFSEIYETVEPRSEDQPAGALGFEDRALPGKLDPGTSGLTVLDVEGDGRLDLLVWSSTGIFLFKNGVTPIENTGLGDLRGVISIAPGDFNNDGLTDLCVITESGALLFENKKGTFQKLAAALPSGRYTKAVWLDFDHDYDVDLFLLGEKSALARNDGSAGFSDQTALFPFVSGRASGGAFYDLIPDTPGFDLAVVYADRSGVLYRDRLAGKYEAVPLDAFPAGARSITAYDFDNDGWTDLVADYASSVVLGRNRQGNVERIPVPESARGPSAFADLERRGRGDLVAAGAIYRNMGLGRFEQKTPPDIGSAIALAAADFDDDARIDLAVVRPDGSLHLVANRTPGAAGWLRVGLTGVKNPKLALGAQIEVKAGTSYQKRTYQGIPLLFGLRAAQEVDTVRITWPNGLIQNQSKQAINKTEIYKEAQRLSGSCPMIFAWNGRAFEFITDVLGVAPLGASSGSGEYFPLDHDEYIQIPGESLATVNGRHEIRITEELHEVSYLDQIRLIAVDHPREIEIFTNEKFKAPPFPDFRLYGVKQRIYPVAATDNQDRDVLDRVLNRDRIYPDGFRRTSSGVAEPHHLDLDFGTAAAGNRALLILSGWVDWADGSAFLGAAQEKQGGLILPYLQVKDATGQWRTVIEDMGIPAGKPKTIVVDLTGKFLSSARQVRIVTSLCVYWDQIFLSEETGAPAVRLTPVNAESAELRFHGFSRPTIDPERKQPEHFDYSQVTAVSMWNPTPGRYTRYGDVRPLLEKADDRMAILGSGDELRLTFSAGSLPALDSGWKRDFLLLVDGWAKDGDANTAFSQSVEPLPFHGMSRYPYPPNERYPEDEVHSLYRVQYNTRPALRLIRPLAETRVQGQ